MILFLDIDGVLHPEVGYRPEEVLHRAPLLESVLREFPAVEIVISSTWRETWSLERLRNLFSPDIGERIIGVTPHWSDVQGPFEAGSYVRQAEIEGWLKRANRSWESWIALDDKPYLFKPFLPNLIKCDGKVGLTDETVELLRCAFSKWGR